MIKMRPPQGKTFGGIEGREIKTESDGSIMAHPRDVDTLTAHGFEPWDRNDTDLDGMERPGMLALAMRQFRSDLETMSDDDLRASLRRRREAATPPTPKAPPTDASPPPGVVSEARIETMNRNELFAYLAEHGVSSPPPVSNQELRTRALDTLHKTKAT